MRAGWLVALAPLVGCFHPSYDHPACASDGACPDGLVCTADNVCSETGLARDGGATDTAPTSFCYGAGLVHACFDAMPTGNPTVADATFDTDTDSRCQIVAQPSGPELCVYAANALTFNGAVTLTGSRPLVVVAATAMTISEGARIDATSGAATRGAGGNATQCSPGTPGQSTAGGAGGGAGGSFGTAGGAGGKGTGGIAGTAGAATLAPTALHGGCPGTAGGDGRSAGAAGPAGGNGGGAIYLIAGNSITIAGDVFASGAGGATRVNINGELEGAGGGGSGGMIGLDAPSITISGRIAANGGGGGGGGGMSTGGGAGAVGSTLNWSTPAAGGVGASVILGAAGNGGAGAASQTVAVAGKAGSGGGDAGGGGGGGGLGLVWIYGTVSGGTMISPTPALHDRQ